MDQESHLQDARSSRTTTNQCADAERR